MTKCNTTVKTTITSRGFNATPDIMFNAWNLTVFKSYSLEICLSSVRGGDGGVEDMAGERAWGQGLMLSTGSWRVGHWRGVWRRTVARQMWWS